MTAQSLGGDILDERPRSAAGLWPLVPIGAAVFSLSALVYYHVRQETISPAATLLQSIVVGIYRSVGFVPSFLFFLLVLSWSSIWFLNGRLEKPWARLSRLGGFTLALAIWLNLRGDGELAPSHAGAIGAWFAAHMVSVFGFVISTLLVGPLAIGAFLMATDFFFYRYIDEAWFARARAADPDQGEITVDTGVEPAVTEYFKGLASSQPRASAAGFIARAGASMPRTAMADAPVEAQHSAADAVVAEAEEVRPLRRERRHRSSWSRRHEADAATPDESPAEALAGDEEPTAVAPMAEPPAAAPVSSWTKPVGRAYDETEAPEDWSLGAAVQDDEDTDDDLIVGGEDRSEATAPSTRRVQRSDVDLPFDPEPAPADAEAAAAVDPTPAERRAAASDADAEREVHGDDVSDADVSDEPVVAIPRPPEGARQRRLFASSKLEPTLIAEAKDLVLNTRRASATHLQRKLRVEFDQAMELLAILGRAGVIEIAAGETQGRVLQ